ncbi:MAG: LpqB family beta-propeller domain-containing protein [Vicinamibacterales bacterium]
MMWRGIAAGLAVIVVAMAFPTLRHLRETPPPPPPVVRVDLSIPAGVTLGSSEDALDAAISPDEGRVAFVATRDGTTELWMQSLVDGISRPLPGTTGAMLPAWKPDGSAVAYFAGGKLKVLTLASGASTEVFDTPAPAGVSWLADGSLVVAGEAGGVITRVVDGGSRDITTLAPGDVAHTFPFVDHSGRMIYVAVRTNGARVIRRVTDADGDARTAPFEGPSSSVDLTESAGHAEIRGEMLVHVRDGVLLAQRLDENGTRLIGRSSALATGMGASERGRGYFATSSTMVVWAAAVPRLSELAWFDHNGVRLGAATEPGDYWQVRLSPNGRDAAVTRLDPLLRTLDVVAIPLAAPGEARRISLSIGPDTDPVWSPDGTTLVYRSGQSGAGALMSRPSGVSAAPETPILRGNVDLVPSDWRADTILLSSLSADTPGARRIVSVFDRRRNVQTPIANSAFGSWNARWAPGGQSIALVSDESGQPEIYIQAYPAGTPKVRATFGGAQRPAWGRDGSLYFIRGSSVMRALVSAGTPPTVATPRVVLTTTGLRDFAVSPTGDRILVIDAAPGTQVPDAHLIFEWQTTVPPPPAPVPKL